MDAVGPRPDGGGRRAALAGVVGDTTGEEAEAMAGSVGTVEADNIVGLSRNRNIN